MLLVTRRTNGLISGNVPEANLFLLVGRWGGYLIEKVLFDFVLFILGGSPAYEFYVPKRRHVKFRGRGTTGK